MLGKVRLLGYDDAYNKYIKVVFIIEFKDGHGFGRK